MAKPLDVSEFMDPILHHRLQLGGAVLGKDWVGSCVSRPIAIQTLKPAGKRFRVSGMVWDRTMQWLTISLHYILWLAGQ